MTVFPYELDSDETIQRIDDNLSEIGSQVINQLRSATFSIEAAIGIEPMGSMGSLADRLNVSLNPNGTIKASALTSVGLATLPIVDNQVAFNAGIKEYKLSLDYSTATLYAQITSNTTLLNSLSTFALTTNSDLLTHISGGAILSDGITPGRHVASQIDLNAVPVDPRDISYNWTGLIDKNGVPFTATQVAAALLELNTNFVTHQLDQSGDAHYATGVSVDTSNFQVIPSDADTVQKALDAIDNTDFIVISNHQQDMHSNGVPRTARSYALNLPDGYSQNIIPPTPANAYLVNPPATGPVDSNSTGDDIISFVPTNTGFVFDAQFAQVKLGDIVRINYGNGVEAIFEIESMRHTPGVEWVVRINGTNLFNADGYEALVRIDRKPFDENKFGSVAVAAANNDINPTIMSSLIVGDAKGANALGLEFDPNQLDSSHYNLYLTIYPTGNPNEASFDLPAIDVTGNAGTTPGAYTLETIVQTVNDAFRSGGYNYRFIAYGHDGEFGIMLADSINNASFSITNGIVSGSSLVAGSFTNNVVGDATDGKDAFGFGAAKTAVASPSFTTSYSSGTAGTSYPTVIIPPLKNRNYVVNGLKLDRFAETYAANQDGYWDGYISNRVPVGAVTVETTYYIPMDLAPAGLKAGKTIIVQPTVSRDSSLFLEQDYGRFVIKSVQFSSCGCGPSGVSTSITVVNSIYGTGSPVGLSSSPTLDVQIYFSDDSVSFNESNIIDAVAPFDTFLRYHQVFVDDGGNTFTHEVARMPYQAETPNLIGITNDWTITEVSSRLTGFRDSFASTPNHYVRFYILNYDSTTGEYDGYIGRRDASTGISDTGRITKARKNIPARFYDSSNLDYVELMFTENGMFDGTAILSSNVPKYVDIEVFAQVVKDQEFFLLAGCCLKGNRVEAVRDLREFGNVSEKDFTTSAIQFIESGERFLHQNGVITGLDYNQEVSGTLYFKGGIALVNGHIATLNAQGISIPEVVQVETGPTIISNLDWAVCVNDKNYLEMVLLTSTKNQAFVKRVADVDNYYIPSMTFSELVNTRKDLTPIAIVNVTIASITVNSVKDARKFVASETSNIPLVLYGNDSSDGVGITVGNFTSFEQLFVWANGFSDYDNCYVKVRGRIDIDQEVSFMDLTKPLTLDGEDGNLITVTSTIGFRLGSYVTLKNLNFEFNTTFGSLTVGDNAHLTNGSACVYIDAVSTLDKSNVVIDGCKFTRNSTGERTPFIMGIISQSLLDRVTVNNNTFTPDVDDALNCAIAMFSSNSAESLFSNITISNNFVYSKNSILVTCDVTSPFCRNVNIINNSITSGYIGYRASSDDDGNFPIDTGIVIADNKAIFIGSMNNLGKYSGAGTLALGTGYVQVLRNSLVTFAALVLGTIGSDPYSNNAIKQNLIIDGNTFFAASNDIGADIGLFSTNAMYVNGSQDGYSPILIRNNVINGTDDANQYNTPILLGGVCGIIESNFISNFIGTGILCSTGNKSVVRGNVINRGANVISAYVVGGDNTDIYNNTFDAPTIDGSNETTIVGSPTAVIEKNTNQIVTTYLSFRNAGLRPGRNSTNTSYLFRNDGNPYDGIDQTYYFDSGTTAELEGPEPSIFTECAWDLSAMLPSSAKIMEININYSKSAGPTWDGSNIQARLVRVESSTTTLETTPSLSLDGAAFESGTLTLTDMNYPIQNNLVFRVNSDCDLVTAGTSNLTLTGFNVKYRY